MPYDECGGSPSRAWARKATVSEPPPLRDATLLPPENGRRWTRCSRCSWASTMQSARRRETEISQRPAIGGRDCVRMGRECDATVSVLSDGADFRDVGLDWPSGRTGRQVRPGNGFGDRGARCGHRKKDQQSRLSPMGE